MKKGWGGKSNHNCPFTRNRGMAPSKNHTHTHTIMHTMCWPVFNSSSDGFFFHSAAWSNHVGVCFGTGFGGLLQLAVIRVVNYIPASSHTLFTQPSGLTQTLAFWKKNSPNHMPVLFHSPLTGLVTVLKHNVLLMWSVAVYERAIKVVSPTIQLFFSFISSMVG